MYYKSVSSRALSHCWRKPTIHCSSRFISQWNVLCEIGSRLVRNDSLSHCFFFYSGADPTRITQGPVDMEIIVGESIVLPCQVASDPVLDVSFSWAFNGQLIAEGDGHFELVGGVSDPAFILLQNVRMGIWHLFPILLHFIPAIR